MDKKGEEGQDGRERREGAQHGCNVVSSAHWRVPATKLRTQEGTASFQEGVREAGARSSRAANASPRILDLIP